ENSVANNGATQRTAELVEDRAGFGQHLAVLVSRRDKWVPRIEHVRLVILESGTMEFIAARLRNDIHLSAKYATVLSGENATHKLHFLNGIDTYHVDVVARAILRHSSLLRIRVGISAVHADSGSHRADTVQPGIPSRTDVHTRCQSQYIADVAIS